MTLKEMEIVIKNLQKDVAALASRPVTARSEAATASANDAKKSAEFAAAKADGYAEAITDMALAQEELITDIIPAMMETEV